MAVETKLPDDFSGKTLKLNSPTGLSPLQITWPSAREHEIYAARTKEFEDTIKLVREDFPEIIPNHSQVKRVFERYFEDGCFENAQKLAEKYNKVIASWVKINRGTEHFCHLSKRECSSQLAEHVLKQVYRMSVPDPSVLNQYASFSSETYGETNFKQMEVILNELAKQGKWKKDEVFVDLGSGIGSIVMQAAACCQSLKCAIGIEIQENPNKIAATAMKKFEYLMGWYGKKYCPIDLYDGSFMDQPHKWRNVKNNKNDADFDWRREATVIFVNNYAFSEDLNLKLKRAFGEMNEGTKIISTKEFCPVDFKINDRNAGNDIGSIMRVSEMCSVRDGFSWTHNSVNVFLSEIDNTKLQEYYESKHQRKIKSDRSSSSSPVPSSLDPLKHKKTLKTNAPMKKASKGEIKQEPPSLSDSEDLAQSASSQQARKVAVVNPTKTQHKASSRKHKIKKESSLLNGQNKAAFDRFHHDQCKALNNNATPNGVVNGHQMGYLDEIPAQAVDEAFAIASLKCKKYFREAIDQVAKLPKDKFKIMKESEDRTIEKLKRLVREEEQAVKKLNRKAEQSYRAELPYHQRKVNMTNSATEDAIAKEEAQIAQLNGQIRRQNGHHHNYQHHNHSVKGNEKKEKEKQDPLPPRFAPPSPYSSIPLSPHSIKSSPSSDAKVDLMEYHAYNRLVDAKQQTTVATASSHRKAASEHFPINLTPNTEQQRTSGSNNANSLGSSGSGSSSNFEPTTSPRQQQAAKRTRIPSRESNGSVLIPGGGVQVAGNKQQQHQTPSVIQHIHPTSPHLISTSQAPSTNHGNVIRNTTSLPPDTVVRYSGQKHSLFNDHALYGGLHGFPTTSTNHHQQTGASSSSAYPVATQCPSQVQQLVKVPIVPGLPLTSPTPMSVNELTMLQQNPHLASNGYSTFPAYFMAYGATATGGPKLARFPTSTTAVPHHPPPPGASVASHISTTHQTTVTAQTPPKKQKR